MRQLLFSLLLLGLLMVNPNVSAQNKLLSVSEAKEQLRQAQEQFDIEKRAFDALSNEKKKDNDAHMALREAGKKVGKYRFEVFKAHKRDFIREQANLSSEEADRFFPIYEEMQDSILRLNDKVQRTSKRLLRSKKEVSDSDYLSAIQLRIENAAKVAELQKEYCEKFKKILSAKKLLLIYDADARFSHEMMNRKEEPNRPAPPRQGR